MKGKLIVFEGIDGSGKATQTKLLLNYLKEKGYEVEKIDFPRHGEKASVFVDNYLLGKYGTAIEVGALRASIFYACDRYDAGFKIKEWLNKGKIVLVDRYVTSNIGHQGGKIKNTKKRSEFFKWTMNLEFELFKIPKPNITILLKTNPQLSNKLAGTSTDKEKQKRAASYLGKEKKDIHEKDIQHLKDALNSYIQFAKEYPEYMKVVECIEKGNFLSKEEIHQKIINLIQKLKIIN